jgi:purine-binding chemotaxis protein CheW
MEKPGTKIDILKQRAEVLKKTPNSEISEDNKSGYLEFLLSGEKYAIEITSINEVIPLKEFTPLPGTPDFVVGIINVRGKIIAVIDIKKFFDLPGKGITDLDKVIILSHSDIELGILADDIIGSSEISISEFQKNIPDIIGNLNGFVMGITHTGLIVLDIRKILADEKITINNKA